MNVDSLEVKTKFRIGECVRERGNPVAGTIVGPGAYLGEWRIALASGATLGCLEDNLERCGDAQPPAGCGVLLPVPKPS